MQPKNRKRKTTENFNVRCLPTYPTPLYRIFHARILGFREAPVETWLLMLYRSIVVFALVVLAACGKDVDGVPISIGQASNQTPDTNYNVIHSFKGRRDDGADPFAGLLSAGGKLYGTTTEGGASPASGGCGTVFEITPSDSERIQYSFQCSPDGGFPTDAPVTLDGSLYGTTAGGGKYDQGTVFTLNKRGKEHVIYSFEGVNGNDGGQPSAGLVAINGNMYGTTPVGGNYGQGTVFVVTPTGHERLIHSFGRSGDGAGPTAGLIAINGLLYGTTGGGGADNLGTVFRVTTSGKERVIYSFKGPPDGAAPQTELMEGGREFYGTSGGGKYNVGTVFQVSASGVEHVLYAFGSRSYDGQYPSSPLTVIKGIFYGVTAGGGAKQGGTVFSVTASGKETILHNFGLYSGASYPNGRLIVVGNALLGTTHYGGEKNVGTVFSFRP
jgi:uncharacterized repeat protein (TIGR03803 family)